MPIFQYYNPYRRPNFYNNYRPYGANRTPNCITKSEIPPTLNPSPNYTSNNFPNSMDRFSTQNEQKIDSFSNSSKTSGQKENRFKSNVNETVWLDLFGIKLYFDDVLIMSLLYFLYEEEVKDEGLFLSLVLLLIS